MKDWVKPYILQRTAEYVDGLVNQGSEKEQWLALKSKALEDPDILYHELTLCLNCHFGREIGDPQEFFYKVFGSVLSDLPEEVFMKLCGMDNLFFTYNPNPEGEMKVFEVDHEIPGGNLRVVTFPYCSGFLSPNALRGEIVHELVHVYKGVVDIIEQEDQINSTAIEWGFEEEIRAAKQYKERRQPEERHRPLEIRRSTVPPKSPETPLLVMKGKGGVEKTIHKIKRGTTSIGRNSANDIVLKDPYVSGHHARICFQDDAYFLYDCLSKNGTRVNGQKIQKRRLIDVDIIEIGRSTFAFISKQVS